MRRSTRIPTLGCTSSEAAGSRGDYAYPLPLQLISTWLGVTPGDEHELSRWGRAIAASVDTPLPTTARHAARLFTATLTRRAHPVTTMKATPE